jgi:hypothetical protein
MAGEDCSVISREWRLLRLKAPPQSWYTRLTTVQYFCAPDHFNTIFAAHEVVKSLPHGGLLIRCRESVSLTYTRLAPWSLLLFWVWLVMRFN